MRVLNKTEAAVAKKYIAAGLNLVGSISRAWAWGACRLNPGRPVADLYDEMADEALKPLLEKEED